MLEQLTKPQLLERAARRRIIGRWRMTKAELIKSLRAKKGAAKKGRAKKSLPRFRIYTIVGCPYCAKAKELLRRKRLPFQGITVTDQNRDKIYRRIDRQTDGYRYFPVIFRNDKFIGGYAELAQMYT